MFARSLKILAVGATAGAGALFMGAGAAHAAPPPINPPQVHLNKCALDPSLCPPQPPPPQPPNPSGSGGTNGSANGANNGSANGSSSAGGGSTATQTGTGQAASVPADGLPPVVHKGVKQASDGSSPEGLFLAGGSALAAGLAGLTGLVVWRRRRAVA